jgi:autotransporter-associated beta strand protein
MPGSESGALGTITLQQGLTVDQRLYVETDIRDADAAADLVKVVGDLTLTDNGKLIFTVVPDTDTPQPARYKLMEYTGQCSGDLSLISVRGLQGLSYSIVNEEQAIWLVIKAQRAPAQGVRWTGAVDNLWDYQTANFSLSGESTEFVAGDGIIIGDDAVKNTLQVSELMPVSGVTFENDTKTVTVNGTGGFTGSGDVVISGKGRVVLNTTASDYTGKTMINSGTVTVAELADGGLPSSIGAATANASNWQMGKATLIVSNSNTATNRGLTLNDTATIQINSGVTALKGIIQGKGRLVKKGNGQLNITYAGNNTWKSTELNAGTLAMGVWNTTFGAPSSTIDVTGNAAITIFDNNSTSAVPSLTNTINVQKGKTLTVNGGQRCNVQGKWTGEGTVKISFPYVRGDFSTNLSDFEGVLNPTGGQFRLVSGMNMQKGTFTPGSGVYAVGVKAGSGTENSYSHKVGALSGTATDAQLGTSVWNVGYLGTSTTFAGIIGANATLNKYGEGALTLTGSSTGKINVYEGSVSLENTTATTTALITVANGGMATGTGTTSDITVNAGGTVGAGKPAGTTTGTLTLTGKLLVQDGGCIRVRCVGRNQAVDVLNVNGSVSLNNPVFLMERRSGSWQTDTDYRVFTGTGTITLNGTPTFEPANPLEGYVWDYSALATDGILRVVADPTGIEEVKSEELKVKSEGEWYDLSGRRVEKPTKGFYIRNGKKYWSK